MTEINAITADSQLETERQNKSFSTNYANAPEFTITDLLNKFQRLPGMTALLGVVDEKIPVMFDLKDPVPGSILMINDHLPSIRRLMLTMIQTLCSLNSPSEFQYVIISEFPDKWMDLISGIDAEYAYCSGIAGGHEDSAEDWILYLAQRTEDRLNGKVAGPSVLLFIDDAVQLEAFDLQVRLNYEWLVKNSAKVNIWLITGMDISKKINSSKFLNLFKTKLFGKMNAVNYSKLDGFVPASILDGLHPFRNFATKIGSEWIRFWAPKLQG